MRSVLVLVLSTCLVVGTCCPLALAGPREITLIWPNVVTQELMHSGNYTVTVAGINDILYDYNLTVNLNAAVSLPPLVGLQNGAQQAETAAGSAASKLAARTLANDPCQQVANDLESLRKQSAALRDAIPPALKQLQQPSKDSSGKFSSIPLGDTLRALSSMPLAAELSKYDDGWTKLHRHIDLLAKGTDCGQEDAIGPLDKLETQVTKLSNPDPLAHKISVGAYLDRTRGGTISVYEKYNGSDTVQSPQKYTLEAAFSAITASGGFLLTELPARSYSSVNQPMTMGTTTTTQTVLGVSGSSHIRPGLAALFNFHDPFDWLLNQPNYGFAISAGPVFDVSNGMADTSKLGFFGGVSVHLWKYFYVTPGVHVGQFADFPQGFTHAGQVIPTNFGTLSPVQRYSARFGLTVTFKGFDFTKLLGSGSKNGGTNPTPTTASGSH